MKIRWKIYYIDGSTFSNKDGKPEDAPGWGVAAVAQEDDVTGVLIHHQHDFYCFDKQFGGWYGMDIWGVSQYFAKPGKKIIKLGEVMPTNKYRELIASLSGDPDLPNKSARYDWERRLDE